MGQAPYPTYCVERHCACLVPESQECVVESGVKDTPEVPGVSSSLLAIPLPSSYDPSSCDIGEIADERTALGFELAAPAAHAHIGAETDEGSMMPPVLAVPQSAFFGRGEGHYQPVVAQGPAETAVLNPPTEQPRLGPDGPRTGPPSTLGPAGDFSERWPVSLSGTTNMVHRRYRFADCYEMGRKLGEGSYAEVYAALERERWQSMSYRRTRASSQDPPGTVAGTSAAEHPSEEEAAAAEAWARAAAAMAEKISSKSSTTASGARRRVAVKRFSMPAMQAKKKDGSQRVSGYDSQGKRASFETERALLSRLEHPNIVKLYESFKESEALYMVLEQCPGGELYDRMTLHAMRGPHGKLNETLARTLFRQVLSACAYIHSLGIVHRDIKTENFLLMGAENFPGAESLKICDFGSAAILTAETPRTMDKAGTLSYTAPEVYADRGATVCADLWSLGVVLYVMVTGLNPFRLPDSSSREITVSRIKSGHFDQSRQGWLFAPEKAKDLVRRFLVLDEEKRLTCAQALSHPWILEDDAPPCLGPNLLISAPGVAAPVGCAEEVLQRLAQLSRLDPEYRLLLAASARLVNEADLMLEVSWPFADVFMAWDQTRSCRLRYDDMRDCLRYCRQELRTKGVGLALDEAHDTALIEALDFDRSGFIEWDEWLALAILDAMLHRRPECVGSTWATIFRMLDGETADGAISAVDMLARSSRTSSVSKVTGASVDMGDLLRSWSSARCGTIADSAGNDQHLGVSEEVYVTFRDFDRMMGGMANTVKPAGL